ncbi:MAG: T9SS type A sorting domain-containing protein [Candidatus Delongbacteria bacterium]|nr:T9SS type A sorting domain-containing protein [Candidatus Delongbacteria bacterium]
MKKVLLVSLLLVLSINVFSQTAEAPSAGDGSSGNPYQISTWQNLYWLSQNDTYYKYCIQTNDINFGEAEPKIQTWDSLRGFTPLYLHSYNGKGFSIDSLYINRPTKNSVGLFQSTPRWSDIDSLTLTNVNVTGLDYVGGLCGSIMGSVKDCHVSGNVTGDSYVGGLVGVNSTEEMQFEEIRNSVSTCNVTGIDYVGGLVGINGSGIYDSHSTNAIIQGVQYVGGFVGRTSYDMIDQAQYEILRCFAANEVRGNTMVGGFVGENSGTIQDCFSKGDVNVETDIDNSCGGFCGRARYTNGIVNCYSTGSVNYNFSDPIDKGFLGTLASDPPILQSNFFDNESSNQLTDLNNAATGIPTGEMQTASTFTDAGWDFVGETTNGTDDFWDINGVTNGGYPFLSWMSTSIDNQQLTINNYELHQNYPNPFNPVTTISFSIQKIQNVKLSVYNSNSQLVQELINEKLSSGNHSVFFDAQNLNSGIYFYTLQVDDKRMSNKMLFIK